MNLEDLLAGLEKKAGMSNEDDKNLSPEEEKAKYCAIAEEEKKKKEKEEKSESKKEEKTESHEKSAAFKSGEQLAKEIMEKVASTTIDNTTNKGDQMNKSASDAGKALAQALLTKLAGVGDVNTTYGIPAGVVPNKTQADLAAQVAEQDAIIQSTPGTDGAGNGGTVNQIFDAIVADAKAKGVVDQFGQSPTAPAEGAQSARQAPNQAPMAEMHDLGQEQQEKAAAVTALVNGGVDFDEAVSLVKRASDEIEAEHNTHVKQAALNELLNNGVNFDLAIALVKQF